MPINDADIRFRAQLDDDISPRIDRLERRLRQMGATPAEIKMFLRAHDEATPKIKEAQKHIDRLPKEHRMRIHADTAEVEKSLKKVRADTEKPIRLTFVDNLQETMNRLFSLRSRANMPGNMPGAQMLYGLGAGAGIIGAGAAVGGMVSQGVQVNSQMEQSMIMLNQTLKDQSQATREMGQIVKIAQQTPFQYKDVLAADVRLRQYNIPTMQGEGGPNNQGWLKSAGDMAAAMGTPMTQAVEAIADARQGYFVRMMSYGIRMMREDFQAGGKFAGQTFEQGLSQSIRRFQGAQEAQSQSLQGLVSNLRDVMEQGVLKPIGEPAFDFLKQGAENAQNKLQDPDFQRELGKTLEDVQDRFTDLFDLIQRGRAFFEDNLQEPLRKLGEQLVNIGTTFAKTFGGLFADVLPAVAQMLYAVVKPLTDFVQAHPSLVKVYATFKALSLLGFQQPLDGMNQFGRSLFRLIPSITGMYKGLNTIVSGSIKAGFLALTVAFVNAASATERLEKATKELSAGDRFKEINRELSQMSGGLDQTSTKMKELAANAARGLKPGAGIDVAVDQARMAAAINRDYGIDADTANRLISGEGIKNSRDVDAAGKALAALKNSSDALKMSFDDAVRVIGQLAKQSDPVGLGGLKGGPYLAAALKTAQGKGFITDENLSQGIAGPRQLVKRMLEEYRSPNIETMRELGFDRTAQMYNINLDNPELRLREANRLSPMPSAQLGRKPTPLQTSNNQLRIIEDIRRRYGANIEAEDDAQAQINRVARRTGGSATQLPQIADRRAPDTIFDPKQILNARNGAQAASLLAAGLGKTRTEMDRLNPEIDRYSESLSAAQGAAARWQQAQVRNGWAIQKFQHELVPLQQNIEHLQAAMQRYQNEAMRPLEREMSRLGQQSAELGNKMSNAQYSMSKWTTGLLDGEQAALDQTHALERHQRQLQILQMSYNQIGAQLGTNTFQRGYSSRVAPLMGLSMQMQMERNERRLQMKRLQDEENFGEDRYQLQQAARSENERTERSFRERMQGIQKTRPVIDEVTKAQHALGNETFRTQTRLFHANEHLQDMQDRLSGLQETLTRKQISKEFRSLQESAFQYGRRTEVANTHIGEMEQKLEKLKDRLTDLRDVQDVFRKWWENAAEFSEDPAENAERMLAVAEAAGLITDKNRAKMQAMFDKVTREIDKTEKPVTAANLPDIIKHAIRGAFTGDLWRRMADTIGATGLFGNLATGIATALAGILTAFVGVGLARTGMRQVGGRAVGRIIEAALPMEMIAMRANRAAARTRAWGIRAGGYDPVVGNQPWVGRRLRGISEGFSRIASGEARIGRTLAGGPFLREMGGNFRVFRRLSRILGGRAGGRLAGLFGADPRLGTMVGESVGQSQGLRGMARNTVRLSTGTLRTLRHPIRQSQRGLDSAVTRFGRSEGRFGRAVRSFAGAAAGISLVFSSFKKWAAEHIPGFRKTPEGPHAPGALGHPNADNVDRGPNSEGRGPGGSGTAALTEEQAARKAQERAARDPKFRKALEDARSRGSKGFVYAGKALRFAGKWGARGAGALSFLPAGEAALEGEWGKAALEAANAGTYFIPGIGEARLGMDATKAVVDAYAPTYGRPGRTPDAAAAMRLAEGPAPLFSAVQRNPALRGNISQMEGTILKVNKMRQAQLAESLAHDELSPKKYEETLKELRKVQDLYTRNMNIALSSSQDDADKMNQKYHDRIRNREVEVAKKRVERTTKNYQDTNKETDTGFTNIFRTVDKWMDKNERRIKRSARDLGISMASKPDDGDDKGGPLGWVDKVFAHGGFTGRVIKGKGDSRGYLARVGEEGDELIVPLAPHRRERAKSLLSQAAGMIGYANGGIIQPRFPGVDTAYTTAKGAYDTASRMAFANGGFTGPHGSLAGMNIIANLARTKFGLQVTAGKDDHNPNVAGTNRRSDHNWGGALDESNGRTPTPQMDAFYNFARTRLKNIIKQVIYKHNLVSTGGSVSSYAPDDHFNHVHIALLEQYARNPELTARIISRAARGLNINDLLLSSGDGGGGVSALNLDRVPQSLAHKGVAGMLYYRALRRFRRKVLRRGGTGAGGGDLGDFAGGGSNTQNMSLGRRMAAAMGWTGPQWQALKNLWTRESGWSTTADNPTSDAYGIPQSLPGSKMASEGADWRTNPATQIKWGLKYIRGRYGNPAGAWAHSQSVGWYAPGKKNIMSPQIAELHPGERVLNPAEASGHDDAPRRRRKVQDTIDEIRADIRRVVKNLEKANDRDDKKKDTDHLAELNKNLRSRLERAVPVARQAGRSIRNIIMAAGDESGGENTAALVARERPRFQRIVQQDRKADQALVKFTEGLLKSARALQESAKTPVQKKLAEIAEKTSKEAVKAARKVTSFTSTKRGRQAATQLSRRQYLLGAARRGVSSRLAGSITGQKLSKRARSAYDRVARTVRGKVDTKSERNAMNNLRKALNAGLSKSARHLQGLRADARKHASQAARAVGRAAASQVSNIKGLSRETRRTASRIQSGNKVSSARMSSMIKELRKQGPRGRALAQHLTKVRDEVTKTGEKGRKGSDKIHAETKKGRGDNSRAEKKREAAENKAEKRDREIAKETKQLLQRIADKDFSINIVNEAKGASLKSTVVKSRFRSR